MLEIKNVKGECSLHIEGNTVEITAETLTTLHSLFNALYEDDPDAADFFAKTIVFELVKPDSTIFEPYSKED